MEPYPFSYGYERYPRYAVSYDQADIASDAVDCDRTTVENGVEIKITTPAFEFFSGTVTDIQCIAESRSDRRDFCLLTVMNDSNEIVTFRVSKNTLFIDCIPIEVGTEVTGYYRADAPIPMIYPPQYPIRVLAVNLAGRYIIADYFNYYLTTPDSTVTLSITNNTWTINELGIRTCDSLSCQNLVVIFSTPLVSIPQIITPNVVIALEED